VVSRENKESYEKQENYFIMNIFREQYFNNITLIDLTVSEKDA